MFGSCSEQDSNHWKNPHPCYDAEAMTRSLQNGCVLWFTGLPGSGKSTLARAVARKLGRPAFVLDGDELRGGLNRDLGFTAKDRDENIRRAAEVAKLFADAGIVCLAAFVSPSAAMRRQARKIIGPRRFFEIHVSTPLAVCEQRDPKGMYRQARLGKRKLFTGVSAPYEPPRKPALAVDTSAMPLAKATARVVRLLRHG
jgi:adenylyl-sulfate kinase